MNKLLFAIVLALGASVGFTGCNKTEDKKPTDPKPTQDKKPTELIVGRWEGTDGKGRFAAVEFTAFGTVKTMKPDRGSGKFLLRNDGDLDLEFESGGKTESQKCKVKVGDGDLSITDLEGKSDEALFVMPGQYKKVTAFSAGARSASDLILGKWKTEMVRLEFKKDGKFEAHKADKENTLIYTGSYRVRIENNKGREDVYIDIAPDNTLGVITLNDTTLQLTHFPVQFNANLSGAYKRE